MTLAEFTAARLDEDEAGARFMMEREAREGVPRTDWLGSPFAKRMLREAASLRKILARHAPHRTAAGGLACDWCSEDTDDRPQLAKVSWPCGDVRDIAAIWSDHPGYDVAIWSDHPGYDPSWERE